MNLMACAAIMVEKDRWDEFAETENMSTITKNLRKQDSHWWNDLVLCLLTTKSKRKKM